MKGILMKWGTQISMFNLKYLQAGDIVKCISSILFDPIYTEIYWISSEGRQKDRTDDRSRNIVSQTTDCFGKQSCFVVHYVVGVSESSLWAACTKLDYISLLLSKSYSLYEHKFKFLKQSWTVRKVFWTHNCNGDEECTIK